MIFYLELWKAGQLTVAGSVVDLDDAAGIDLADLEASDAVVLTVSGGGVRYRCSAEPTASAGLYHDMQHGPLVITGRDNVVNLKLIRDSGSSSTVTVDFELARSAG